MIAYLDTWIILLTLQMLAVASPGPDFVVAVRNSVVYSRRAGIFTALGFAAGVGVHVFYCIIGIAAVISQSIIIFNIIKYLGAAYLLYIGVKALMSKSALNKTAHIQESACTMRDLHAFRSGFITNVFNPKATMFFLALFTQVIDPATPMTVMGIYAATIIVTTALWFSFVALVLTHGAIRAKFLGFTQWIDRVCGTLMIGLGAKIILTR